jgi:hypothetical protein
MGSMAEMDNYKRILLMKIDPMKVPRCTDYDSDCLGVRSYIKCWLHDPDKGRCPYLVNPYVAPEKPVDTASGDKLTNPLINK